MRDSLPGTALADVGNTVFSLIEFRGMQTTNVSTCRRMLGQAGNPSSIALRASLIAEFHKFEASARPGPVLG
jgi:hypothetical protein